MTRTILVPFDGSVPSRSALEYARGLAGEERVVALNVVEPITGVPEGERGPYERAFERAQERLSEAEVAGTVFGDGLDAEFRYGHPLHELLRYVDRYVVEEVVMGAHGRDGAEDLLLGSVAESLVRRSPVPTTVVRGSGGGDPPGSVLVPFDGSAPSREALSYALERFPDATVTALFADYPVTGDGEHLGPGGDRSTAFEDWYGAVREWHARADRNAESVLRLATRVAEDREGEVETVAEPGEPTHVVLDHVERHADHVVVGSHSRDAVTRQLLGSVAAFVVRRSPTSVTVVR
jgi:nucleotide-binding universal stress UspA family protein